MAEKDEAKKPAGWVKAIMGTIAGLLSGAFMMYATPIFDKFIKPAKPVANFSVENADLTVTFHNRSFGGSHGWWDFGDGSPLEPVDPGRELTTHTYPVAADYTAKLMVSNVIGEESDRSVTIHLDNSKTAAALPIIETFQVVPLTKEPVAPATFCIVATVRNAQGCVFDFGDDRPLEFASDVAEPHQHFVTFKKPGGYVVKMAAWNGNQAKERSEIIYVDETPKNMVTAILTVTEQATRSQNERSAFTFGVTFPQGQTQASQAFDKLFPAKPGFEIVDVRLGAEAGNGLRMNGKSELALPTDLPGVRGVGSLMLKIAPDRQSVHLVGEMVKDSNLLNKNALLPNIVLPVQVTQRRKSATSRTPTVVASAMPAPGAVLINLPPVPAEWSEVRRQVRLELRDGDKSVWHDSQLPKNAPVTVRGKPCLLTAERVGNDQVRVDLDPAKTGVTPAAN